MRGILQEGIDLPTTGYKRVRGISEYGFHDFEIYTEDNKKSYFFPNVKAHNLREAAKYFGEQHNMQ